MAVIAAIVSVAMSPSCEPEYDYGITKVGVSVDGTTYAGYSEGGRYASHDGGLNWTEWPADESIIDWGDDTARTPRGRYVIEGADILRLDSDGRSKRVYSAAYLQKAGNVWAQDNASRVPRPRGIATRPLEIVHDPWTGNLIVAMGIQGVVVGTPDGRWERVAVGGYSPTDFSFTAKTRLLLSRLDFWAVSVALSFSMICAALIYAERDAEDSRPSTLTRRREMVLIAIVVAVVLVGLYVISNLVEGWGYLALPFVFAIPALLVILSCVTHRQGKLGMVLPHGILALLAVATAVIIGRHSPGLARTSFWDAVLVGLIIPAPILAGIALGLMPRQSSLRKILVLLAGTLSLVASCLMLTWFENTDDDWLSHGISTVIFGVPAFGLGTVAALASWRQLKYWPAVIASFAGMIALVVSTFMSWLHVGIPLSLAKLSAFVLTALVAFVLASYLGRKAIRPDPETL